MPLKYKIFIFETLKDMDFCLALRYSEPLCNVSK